MSSMQSLLQVIEFYNGVVCNGLHNFAVKT